MARRPITAWPCSRSCRSSQCHSRQWCGIEHSRHAICTLPGGIELHNFYIPAGGDVPDPELNPKFRHKLDMLAELTDWLAMRRGDGARVVLVGDLNIAPLENDVWSHRQLLNVVSHTPVETEALLRMQAAYGFVDAVRAVVPAEREALHVVVVPGAGLGGVRPRPAARPHLAVARAGPEPGDRRGRARGARLGQSERPCAGDGGARGLSDGRLQALPPLAVTMGEPAGIGGEITLAAWRRLAGRGPVFLALDDPERLRGLAGAPPIREIAEPAEAARGVRPCPAGAGAGAAGRGRAGPA